MSTYEYPTSAPAVTYTTTTRVSLPVYPGILRSPLNDGAGGRCPHCGKTLDEK